MATNQPTDRVLAAQSVGADLGDGFYVLPGMGNALVAETDAGLVLVDAGSQFTTPGMIEHLRNATESPLHAICYSHGHLNASKMNKLNTNPCMTTFPEHQTCAT